MVELPYVSVFAGAAGGALRGLVGYFQAVKDNPEEKWDWNKFGQSILRSAAVGLVGGMTVILDPVTAFLAGFSGDVVLHDLGLKV